MKVNLIPMAGMGSRFLKEGFNIPKPLIQVSGQPMILKAAQSLPEADKWIFVCQQSHLTNSPLSEILKEQYPGCIIIPIDHITEGQACTCLMAEEFINKEDSLMIGACDNGMTWDADKFNSLCEDINVNALIFTFRHNVTVKRHPEMYGWVKIDKDNFVQETSVKIPISADPINDHAIVGSFWFRRAGDFFDRVKEMMTKDARINNEFYVDKVFDFFISSKLNVKVFEIEKYICWGTPNDLRTYKYWEEYFNKTALK